MVFIVTTILSKLLPLYFPDKEYHALQLHLIENPNVGDIIVGGGGVGKMRWAIGGSWQQRKKRRNSSDLLLERNSR